MCVWVWCVCLETLSLFWGAIVYPPFSRPPPSPISLFAQIQLLPNDDDLIVLVGRSVVGRRVSIVETSRPDRGSPRDVFGHIGRRAHGPGQHVGRTGIGDDHEGRTRGRGQAQGRVDPAG